MEQYKLDNFKKANPNISLQYRPLSDIDSILIITSCQQILKINQTILTTQELFKEFIDALLYSYDVPDENYEYVLTTVLNASGIHDDSIVYIIWEFETPVDQFTNKYFLDHLNDVWYDASDEAMILYYPEYQKIILMSEHGYVKTN